MRIGSEKLLSVNSNIYHFFFITFHLFGGWFERARFWHVEVRRQLFGRQFLASTLWALGMEVRSSGLTAEVIS